MELRVKVCKENREKAWEEYNAQVLLEARKNAQLEH